MVDLSTDYLGLKLANPLVPSASPLSHDLDMAKRLEDAGAPALVMYSLFEETIHNEERQMQRFLVDQGTGFAEADVVVPVPDSGMGAALGYAEDQAVGEAERCLECKKPKCVESCPVGIDIPSFVAAVADGRFAEALEIIKADNMLPAICGQDERRWWIVYVGGWLLAAVGMASWASAATASRSPQR